MVYENFRYTSENSQYKNWMEVLKSTNSESHTLLLSRTYSDIRKIDFSSNFSGSLPSYIISVPGGLPHSHAAQKGQLAFKAWTPWSDITPHMAWQCAPLQAFFLQLPQKAKAGMRKTC